MSDLLQTITILFIHWIFDFVLQTDKMALNKSKSNKWLSVHVGMYSIGLLIAGMIILPFNELLIWWVVINAVLHYFQDWLTSRLNSKLYANHRHWFFVSIGFDQFIHYCLLLITLYYAKHG